MNEKMHPVDISEIVGFDPNRLSTPSEHGDILKLGVTEVIPPKDIQEAFIEKVTRQWPHEKELIIQPQHLFYSLYRPNRQGTMRVYSGWGTGIPANEQAFPPTHEIYFEEAIGGLTPVKIDYNHERRVTKYSPDEGCLWYCPTSSVFLGDNWLRLDVHEPQASNFIEVEYYKGKLDRIYMDHEGFYPENMELEKDKFVARHESKGALAYVKALPDSPLMQVVEKLFDDPRLLHDPLNAPVEADTSWKRADLLTAFGVSWTIRGDTSQ